jgi:hypothetical protein
MKNLILLIGLFSTTLCFSADKNGDDVPNKRKRAPATRRVYFAESAKKHDGVRPEKILKEMLIYAYFEKQCIKSKEDIANLIEDKKISLPKKSLIEISEELDGLVVQIEEQGTVSVIAHATGGVHMLQACHKAHLSWLITLFKAYIETVSDPE